MAKSNPMENLFPADFSKAFEGFKGFQGFQGFQGFPLDFSALMETQRRNLQAFSDAGRQAMEDLQEIAQMQTVIVSQMVEDSSAIAREAAAEGSAEQKIARQAEMAKKSYEKTLGGAKKIAEAVGKSNQAASEIISRRVSASLSEIKSAAEKKSAKGK